MALLLGFIAGSLGLYYFLWRTGGLTPGHPLSRTTADITSRGVAGPIVAVNETPPPATTPETTAPARTVSDASAEATPALSFTPLAGFTLGREPLVMPVVGARAADLRDSFEEAGGAKGHHDGIDIPAPRGTAVVAAVDGSIEKLFTAKDSGLTVYEFDRERAYCYSYAHLDHFAEDLREKQLVHRGDRLGYVGSTGDLPGEAPRLHFTILRLGPEKQWWLGTPVNPYPFLLGNR